MPVYNGEFRTGVGQPGPGGLIGVGPILPVEVAVPSALSKILAEQGQSIPSPVSGLVLIDTGATRSCVHIDVVSKLGVNPIGVIELATASGKSQHHLYPAKFNFPAIKFQVEFSSLVGVDLRAQSIGGHQIIALMGRDLLSKCLLIYNGTKGSFSIAL
mgnify:CR=1 FL=1